MYLYGLHKSTFAFNVTCMFLESQWHFLNKSNDDFEIFRHSNTEYKNFNELVYLNIASS